MTSHIHIADRQPPRRIRPVSAAAMALGVFSSAVVITIGAATAVEQVNRASVAHDRENTIGMVSRAGIEVGNRTLRNLQNPSGVILSTETGVPTTCLKEGSPLCGDGLLTIYDAKTAMLSVTLNDGTKAQVPLVYDQGKATYKVATDASKPTL